MSEMLRLTRQRALRSLVRVIYALTLARGWHCLCLCRPMYRGLTFSIIIRFSSVGRSSKRDMAK